ncbi:MAG TPA: serine protease [Gemmatimonadales bacterium]|nr:serine protease [Gemmatimonadales bacterium]
MSVAFLSTSVDLLRASVVQIIEGRRGSGGAGIAWGRPDLFVTSAHVVSRPRVTVVTPDGRAVSGAVIRRDSPRDLAVVHAPGAGDEVPVAHAGVPHIMRPGSLVVAVGHPFGMVDAVSVGVFQAVGPLPRGLGLNGKGSLPWVQADVRLAPGNSGGPLADAEGRVIGVAAMVVSGLALAVPVTDVERLFSGLV